MACLKPLLVKQFHGKIKSNLIDLVKLAQELTSKFSIQTKKAKEKFASKAEICLLAILKMKKLLEKLSIQKDMFTLVILVI